MNKFLKALPLMMVLPFAGNVSAITIQTAGCNADSAVALLLGSGISYQNASCNVTGTSGNALASGGQFDNGLSTIGIKDGIVLGSGYVNDAVGPNSSDATSTNLGSAGDPDAAKLIPGYTTYDATYLLFEFKSISGDLFFDYVFASEEYNEWVGSPFNDVFGFFVDSDKSGTFDVDENIALIPGTTTPVAINNVNNVLNSAFYNDNDFGDFGGSTPYDIEYDGFTDVFTAAVSGLTVGEWYSIKLVIADAGDHILDSAVFLEAGSFSSKIPEPATLMLMGFGLAGLGATRRQRNKQA